MSDERLPDGRLTWTVIGHGRWGTEYNRCNLCGVQVFEQDMLRHERGKVHQLMLDELRKKVERQMVASSPDWFYPLVLKSVESRYSISADSSAARATLRERSVND